MNLFDIPFFDIVRSRMGWLEQRQDTLAQNIANSSTPDYMARDVNQVDFAKLVAGEAQQVRLASTSAGHLKGTVGGGDEFRIVRAPDRESSPDGNSVLLEQQMMKVAETQMQHEAVTGLYRKAIDMLRIAVRGA